MGHVTMDFIIGLPKSEDSGSIIVVVDKFSKYATFIVAPTDCTAEETARLFLKHVVKYWGLPKFIISDRDPRSLGSFGRSSSSLWVRSSASPQAFTHRRMGNREGERLTGALPKALRVRRPIKPVRASHRAATVNSSHLTIGYTGRSPAASSCKGWHEQADIARSYLDKAAKKMKKPVHKGLVRRYEGPFPILGKVGKVSYRVKLPQGLSKRAPTAVMTSYDKEVEHIIADRVIRRRGVPPATEYLVKWKGLPESEASGSSRCTMAVPGAIERFQAEARRGRLRLRWGRVSQADSNEPPHGLYRARKLLETPRVGRVWKVLEKLDESTQFYTMMEGMRGVSAF
ncbi:hypothetical protein CK203_000917 [Vitis vinifera]|uniref:Chromo domain-containing protein n=1 Tax=Vitis vinifera TaxID=29760 RepID=A0A438KQ15_VITVI|nr:hypothetical protein CK203_000917 [Vitis vinifera]